MEAERSEALAALKKLFNQLTSLPITQGQSSEPFSPLWQLFYRTKTLEFTLETIISGYKKDPSQVNLIDEHRELQQQSKSTDIEGLPEPSIVNLLRRIAKSALSYVNILFPPQPSPALAALEGLLAELKRQLVVLNQQPITEERHPEAPLPALNTLYTRTKTLELTLDNIISGYKKDPSQVDLSDELKELKEQSKSTNIEGLPDPSIVNLLCRLAANALTHVNTLLSLQPSPPVQEDVAKNFPELVIRALDGNLRGGDLWSQNQILKENETVPGFVTDFQKQLDIHLDIESLMKELESRPLFVDGDPLDEYAPAALALNVQTGAANSVETANTHTDTVEAVHAPSQSDAPIRGVDYSEFTHIMSLARWDWSRFWVEGAWNQGSKARGPKLKEPEACAAFLHPFALALVEDFTQLEPIRSRDPCPLPFIMETMPNGANGDPEYKRFEPQSDFAIVSSGIPRFVLEVNSTDEASDEPEDLTKMMLTASAVVRFVNTYSKGERMFVLPAVYLGGRGEVRSFLLYQKDGMKEVYYQEESYRLATRRDVVRFGRWLYSLAHALCNNTEDYGKVSSSVGIYRSKVRKLPPFKSKPKSKAQSIKRGNDGEPAGGDRNRHRGEGQGDAGDDKNAVNEGEEELRRRYKVISGVRALGNDKLPRDIREVQDLTRRCTQRLVVKEVKAGSDEARILKLLDGQPDRQHIISVYDIVETPLRTWLILPMLATMDEVFEFATARCAAKAATICRDLLDGVGCLHRLLIAHRDIKPDNLVLDLAELSIKIIDFDLAIQLSKEDEEVDEHCGTEGWEAPELVAEAKMVSPIRCDRWACGAVMLHILIELGREEAEKQLAMIAGQLMARDPSERPSVLEFCQMENGLKQVPCKQGSNLFIEEERKAKKPRLEVGQRPLLVQNVGQVLAH